MRVENFSGMLQSITERLTVLSRLSLLEMASVLSLIDDENVEFSFVLIISFYVYSWNDICTYINN